MRENEVKVIKNYGDQNLGGNDFDYILMDMIVEKLYTEDCVISDENYFEIPPRATPQEKLMFRKRKNRLRKEAERIKIALSSKEEVKIDLNNLFADEDEIDKEYLKQEIIITRDDFESKCGELLSKLKFGIKEVCNISNLNKKDINLVLLIGGTCQIPIVKNKISETLGKEKIAKNDFDSMTAVVMGAAFYSYSEGNKNAQELKISDKITRSLGIEIRCGQFLKIYKKGENLGQTLSQEVFTEEKQQKDVEFDIYCGEKENVGTEGMIRLGSFTLFDIPKYEGMKTHFNVEMEVNESGLLTVRAYSLPPENEKNKEEKKSYGEIKLQLDLTPIDDDKFEEVKKHFDDFKPYSF